MQGTVNFLRILWLFPLTNENNLILGDQVGGEKSLYELVKVRLAEIFMLFCVAVGRANWHFKEFCFLYFVDFSQLPTFAVAHQNENIRVFFVSAGKLWRVRLLLQSDVHFVITNLIVSKLLEVLTAKALFCFAFLYCFFAMSHKQQRFK